MPKKDPYKGDNFKPFLPCDVIDHLESKYKKEKQIEFLTTARKFSKSLFEGGKEYELLRQTVEGDVRASKTNRYFSKGDLKLIKTFKWFQCISKDVTRVLKAIHPKLEIRKFLVLKSAHGCKRQAYHMDHNPDKPRKRYTVIFSIMKDTTLDMKMSSHSNVEISIKLPVGTMAVFRDDLVHAGSAYKNGHYRFYFLGALPDETELGGDELHLSTDDGKLHLPCLYCRNHVTKAKQTSENPLRGLYAHYRVCASKLMMVNEMTKTEAKKTAKENLKGNLGKVKECNKAKAEQDTAAENAQKKLKSV